MSNFHTYSSWGRTRRPKTVSTLEKASTPGGTLETARAVAASEVGNLAADLDSGNEGRNGYATENQRFLHVTVSGANNKSVKIYVYNYAIRVWSALMVNDGDGTFSQATASTAVSACCRATSDVYIRYCWSGQSFVSTDARLVACTTF